MKNMFELIKFILGVILLQCFFIFYSHYYNYNNEYTRYNETLDNNEYTRYNETLDNNEYPRYNETLDSFENIQKFPTNMFIYQI